MKPAPLNLSTPLMPQNFAPPVSPGCPTDGIVTGHAFLPPWATDADHPFTSISRSLSLNATIPTSEALPPSVWRIEPGSYITFELDTAAAAASLPQDSEGYNQILALPVNRYIGLVSSSTTHADTEELVVHYVAREPPPPLTGACLPLAPSSSLASPAPGLLHVAPMFPWPDLVQWTTHGVRLAVAARTDSVLCFALADASLGAFEDHVVLDASEPCVPVRVWRDVREAGAGGGGEPGAFEAEVERLEELLSECRVVFEDDEDDTGDMADDEASTDSGTLFDGDMDDSDHADGDVTMRVDDEL